MPVSYCGYRVFKIWECSVLLQYSCALTHSMQRSVGLSLSLYTNVYFSLTLPSNWCRHNLRNWPALCTPDDVHQLSVKLARSLHTWWCALTVCPLPKSDKSAIFRFLHMACHLTQSMCKQQCCQLMFFQCSHTNIPQYLIASIILSIPSIHKHMCWWNSNSRSWQA
jgi:hypothetical protein